MKEFQRFQSAYCGLCHVMGRRCGWKARFLLNYDFTFLAMLLDGDAPPPADRQCRCMASPFRCRRVCGSTSGFEAAADASVILSYWKLRDTVADEGFFKRLAARFLSLLLRRAYGRAARRQSEFDAVVRRCLEELRQLEQARSPSLDRTADTFARLLQAAGQGLSGAGQRPVEQVLYHVGRWIYLADAYDDLEEDWKRQRYNPVAARFALEQPQLSQKERAQLETTMRHSLNLAVSAYSLASFGRWSDILENILYFSLPLSGARVLSGEKIQWPRSKRKLRNLTE